MLKLTTTMVLTKDEASERDDYGRDRQRHVKPMPYETQHHGQRKQDSPRSGLHRNMEPQPPIHGLACLLLCRHMRMIPMRRSLGDHTCPAQQCPSHRPRRWLRTVVGGGGGYESYAVYGRAADWVARALGPGALPELSAREGGIGVFMRRERSHEGTHPR